MLSSLGRLASRCGRSSRSELSLGYIALSGALPGARGTGRIVDPPALLGASCLPIWTGEIFLGLEPALSEFSTGSAIGEGRASDGIVPIDGEGEAWSGVIAREMRATRGRESASTDRGMRSTSERLRICGVRERAACEMIGSYGRVSKRGLGARVDMTACWQGRGEDG